MSQSFQESNSWDVNDWHGALRCLSLSKKKGKPGAASHNRLDFTETILRLGIKRDLAPEYPRTEFAGPLAKRGVRSWAVSQLINLSLIVLSFCHLALAKWLFWVSPVRGRTPCHACRFSFLWGQFLDLENVAKWVKNKCPESSLNHVKIGNISLRQRVR